MAKGKSELIQLEKEVEELQKKRMKEIKKKYQLETKISIPTPVTFKEYEEFKNVIRPPQNLKLPGLIQNQIKREFYELCGINYCEANEFFLIQLSFGDDATCYCGYEVEIHHAEQDGYQVKSFKLPIGLNINKVKNEFPMNSLDNVRSFVQFLQICGCAYFNRKNQVENLKKYIDDMEFPIDIFSSYDTRYLEIMLPSIKLEKSTNDEPVLFVLKYNIDSFRPVKVTYEKEHICKSDIICLDNFVFYFLNLKLKEALRSMKYYKNSMKQSKVSFEELSWQYISQSQTEDSIDDEPKNSSKHMLQSSEELQDRTNDGSSSSSRTILLSNHVNVQIHQSSESVKNTPSRPTLLKHLRKNCTPKNLLLQETKKSPEMSKKDTAIKVSELNAVYNEDLKSTPERAPFKRFPKRNFLNPDTRTSTPLLKQNLNRQQSLNKNQRNMLTSDQELDDLSSILSSNTEIQNAVEINLNVDPKASSTPFHFTRSKAKEQFSPQMSQLTSTGSIAQRGIQHFFKKMEQSQNKEGNSSTKTGNANGNPTNKKQLPVRKDTPRCKSLQVRKRRSYASVPCQRKRR